MRSFLLLVLGLRLSVRGEDGNCTRSAGGKYFRSEMMLDERSLTDGITADWNNNKVYFPKYLSDNHQEVGEWDIEKKQYRAHGEIPEWCFLTVDQKTSRLYAGCTRITGPGGLYAFDNDTQNFAPLTNDHENAVWTHFADKLYYSDYPYYRVHYYEDGHTHFVPELQDTYVHTFVVNGIGEWVYTLGGNLYYKLGLNDDYRFITNIRFLTVAVDQHGTAYSTTGKEIYRIDTVNNGFTKILDTPQGCYYFAFDKDDNIICLWYGKVYRWVRCQPQEK